jgi:intracellular multiplication protein IcmV
MGIIKWTGKAFTSVVNVRVDRWLGADYIKHTIGQTVDSAKDIFIPEKADRVETFEESLKRLNITEEELKEKETDFIRLFAVHLLIALLIFFYSVFLFHNGNWGGGIMSLCLVTYPLSLAFRFHFWLFQIKNRKLGCSIKEWWNNK